MDAVLSLLVQSLEKVWITFTHNWPFLLASIVISVALRLYVRPEKASAFLMRYRRAGVVGATAVAVATPFCSCGTTAVILGMIASTIPWAPVIAFMVASPLTSPEELVYSAGLFGWPFAIAFFVSSILLGLLGGVVAGIVESRGWLANQVRFSRTGRAAAPAAGEPQLAVNTDAKSGCSCGVQAESANHAAPAFAFRRGLSIRPTRPAFAAETCCVPAVAAPAGGPALAKLAVVNPACECDSRPAAPSSCDCGAEMGQEAQSLTPADGGAQGSTGSKVTPRQWVEEMYRTGRQLLVMFLGFAFIGYVLNGLIPATMIAAVFGPGRVYGIPLAATLGLPLYVNTEGSLPLVRALMDGGMGQGAALAFLITGAGTSFGALAGALTIARWRVITVVVGTLWVGAVVLGFAYDLLLAAHLV